MIISDFHTHSSNSGDSDTKMQLQIEAAIKGGLKHICITEHMDLDYPPCPPGADDCCDFTLDVNSYKKEYDEMKEFFRSSDINVYYGVELGLQTQIVDENTSFIKNNSFDFVIASSHVMDNCCDPYYPDYWEGKKDAEVFRRYFEYIYENICIFDDFDVYGHLDYIVRYGHNKDRDYNYPDFSDEIDAILQKLIEMGKGIEINTGGFKYGLKYANPCPDILMRYRQMGGEILTIGSDAHSPEYIGYKFDVVENLLKECGFKYYTVFKERKAQFIAL